MRKLDLRVSAPPYGIRAMHPGGDWVRIVLQTRNGEQIAADLTPQAAQAVRGEIDQAIAATPTYLTEAAQVTPKRKRRRD